MRPSDDVTVTCICHEDDHVTVTSTGCEAVRDSEEVTVTCTGYEADHDPRDQHEDPRDQPRDKDSSCKHREEVLLRAPLRGGDRDLYRL